ARRGLRAGGAVAEDEVLDEPALADARRAEDRDDARLAALRGRERLVQRRHLGVASDERGAPVANQTPGAQILAHLPLGRTVAGPSPSGKKVDPRALCYA